MLAPQTATSSPSCPFLIAYISFPWAKPGQIHGRSCSVHFYNGTRVNPCMALSTDSAVNTVLHALHLCGTAELSHLPLYQPTPTYVPSQTMQRQLDNILCVLMLGTCSGHCTEALTVSCKSGWHHHPAFSFHTISCLVTKCKASKSLHKR